MVTDEQKNPIKAAVQNSRPLRCHGQISGGLFSRLLLSQQNEVFPYMRSRTFLLALKTLQACPIIKALIKPAILTNSDIRRNHGDVAIVLKSVIPEPNRK
jgi:hypothetical protein